MTLTIQDEINLQESLAINGFQLIAGLNQNAAESYLSSLGLVIHKNSVSPYHFSKSLTNSFKGLGLHTDHHRADYVGLYCEKQSESGGSSLLLDTYPILKQFTEPEKQLLTRIYLKEHKVFPDDVERYPLLTINAREEIYYSYWLVREELNSEQNLVLQKLKKLIENVIPITFRMQNSDLLILDNKRMLHGRSSIGSGERILHRYWIKKGD